MPTNKESAWIRVAAVLPLAKGMYWDGCHKIYLSIDEEQDARFKAEEWDYVSEPDLDTLHDWFDRSCPLRFINAVTTNEEDPNAGYHRLISQFELEHDDL